MINADEMPDRTLGSDFREQMSLLLGLIYFLGGSSFLLGLGPACVFLYVNCLLPPERALAILCGFVGAVLVSLGILSIVAAKKADAKSQKLIASRWIFLILCCLGSCLSSFRFKATICL